MQVSTAPPLTHEQKSFSKTLKNYRTFCVSTCRQVTFQNFIWQGPSLFEPLLPHGTWGATDVDVDMDDKSVQKMDGAGCKFFISLPVWSLGITPWTLIT